MPEAVAVASDAGPALELSAVLAALGAPVEVRPKTSVDWANTPWEMSMMIATTQRPNHV